MAAPKQKLIKLFVAVALLIGLQDVALAADAPALPPPPGGAVSVPAASANQSGAKNGAVKATDDPALAPPILPPNASGTASDAKSTPGIFAGFMDPFDYDSRGRRDPFQQPVADVPVTPGAVHGPLLPLQMFDISQLRVIGILWNVKSPKAMIKDPNGKTHIVETYTKVGPRNGYIAAIREGEIVVVETIEQDGRLVSTSQVVKIAK